ncbi:MAG: flavodoxin reductase, partial [Bacteroidetes bacterium]|nr:flavodoxin reductase [Bacteroidota bacterium]
WVTHNVRRFRVEKPEGYQFLPGQATDITLAIPEWEKERRSFTFTCLKDWDFLEFTIKIYPDHKGVTNQLGQLKTGDFIIIHDAWGAIHYKGPGVFIAGGAGITPFIAILRQLEKEGKLKGNTLLFSNRTSRDIILKDEFEKMLGDHFINILTDEPGAAQKMIDRDYLKEHFHNMDLFFYICGPDPMVLKLTEDLKAIGVKKDNIIIEEF